MSKMAPSKNLGVTDRFFGLFRPDTLLGNCAHIHAGGGTFVTYPYDGGRVGNGVVFEPSSGGVGNAYNGLGVAVVGGGGVVIFDLIGGGR